MTEEDSQELRSAKRLRVLKSARIISADRVFVTDCTIKNISETGALLIVSDQASVPRFFTFLIPRDNKTCQAEVAWRREKLVGISFISAMTVPDSTLTKYIS